MADKRDERSDKSASDWLSTEARPSETMMSGAAAGTMTAPANRPDQHWHSRLCEGKPSPREWGVAKHENAQGHTRTSRSTVLLTY